MSPKKFEVISMGGLTLDIFMKSPDFRVVEKAGKDDLCVGFGDKIIVDEVHLSGGGGGANAAVSLASLGVRVVYLGKAGKDSLGEKVLGDLSKKGVDVSLVVRTEEKQTGLSVAMHTEQKERTLLLYRGGNDDLISADLPWETLANAEWIYLAHLSGKSGELIGDLADFLAGKEIKLVWNPGSTQLKRGLDGLAQLMGETMVLLVNREEAELLAGIEVDRSGDWIGQDEGLNELAQALKARGPEMIVISDGRRGAAVFYQGQFLALPIHEEGEVVRDVVGAGDAFGSGFCAGLIKSSDIETALKWGIVQAGAVITEFGAQNGLLTEKEMKKELKIYNQEIVGIA